MYSPLTSFVSPHSFPLLSPSIRRPHITQPRRPLILSPSATATPLPSASSPATQSAPRDPDAVVLRLPQPPSQYPPLPGRRRFPMVGFLLDAIRGDADTERLAHQYGPVFHADLLSRPMVVVSEVRAIRDIYRDGDTFPSAGSFPPTMPVLFGPEALFTLDGTELHRHRARIRPALLPHSLSRYFGPVKASAEVMWQTAADLLLQKHATRTSDPPTVDLSPLIRQHFLSMFVNVTLSSDGVSEKELQQFDTLFSQFIAGLVTLPFGPIWDRALRARDKLRYLLKERARTRLEHPVFNTPADEVNTRLEFAAGNMDMLTLFTYAGLSDDDDANEEEALDSAARAAVMTWFSGYFTQASSMLSCVMELLCDTDFYEGRIGTGGKTILDWLTEEQSALAVDGEDFSLEDVNKRMPRLESFVLEVLRLAPPTPQLFRKVATPCSIHGHLVRPGTTIALDFLSAHRDDATFPAARTLVPDRFLGSRSKHDGFLAFGVTGGAHHCIGAMLAKMTLKTTLAVMIRQFDVEVVRWRDGERNYRNLPQMVPRWGVKVSKCDRRK